MKGGLSTLGLSGILEQLALRCVVDIYYWTLLKIETSSCDRTCEIYMGFRPLLTSSESLWKLNTGTAFPPGFQKIAHLPHISHQVAAFIADANTVSLIKKFSGFRVTTDAELRFSDARCNSISQHIHQMSSRHSIISISSNRALTLLLERCLCHGLLAYYMMMLRSISPRSHLSLDIGKQLKTTLMQTELAVYWQRDLDLLLWISFMGALTVTEDPLRDWYLCLLTKIRDRLGAKPWPSVKLILEEFLWAEPGEKLGNAIWSEIEANSNVFRSNLCLNI